MTGELEIRVRYAECDPMGYAHHASYPIWLEMGRTELLRRHGVRYRDLEAQGVFIVVVALAIRFRRPARYDDVLALKTTLSRVTHAKLEHEYELVRDGTVIAVATSTLACINREGRPQPIPELLRPGLRQERE